jgi:uncharacterized protein (TIGR03083 family)
VPAEEHVAGGLHEPLPGDYPLAAAGVLARPGEALEHGRPRLRADLAAFLATLTPQQWQAPTLCTRWPVRDVVAHIISYDNLGARALLTVAPRARFRPGRINDTALTRYDQHTPEQLLALLTGNLQPRGQPAALGGRAGLVETLIHHQDIRRALRQPRAIPADRLLPALHTALIAPDISRPWPLRDVRLATTDLRFSLGIGALAEGPAEAILMTNPHGCQQ